MTKTESKITNIMRRIDEAHRPSEAGSAPSPAIRHRQPTDCSARDHQVKVIYQQGGFIAIRPEDQRFSEELRRLMVEEFSRVHRKWMGNR